MLTIMNLVVAQQKVERNQSLVKPIPLLNSNIMVILLIQELLSVW